ncbi:MAG TPA: hypothetical protein VL154_16190, partial [Acetobacteraceae bacterium]|nr:hypothetical protein [Acetobacteraceae bacterium]
MSEGEEGLLCLKAKKQKNFNPWRLVGWVIASLGVVVIAAATLDHFFPPNLARLAQVGTEVADKDGRIVALKPAAGGVWRFRTT